MVLLQYCTFTGWAHLWVYFGFHDDYSLWYNHVVPFCVNVWQTVTVELCIESVLGMSHRHVSTIRGRNFCGVLIGAWIVQLQSLPIDGRPARLIRYFGINHSQQLSIHSHFASNASLYSVCLQQYPAWCNIQLLTVLWNSHSLSMQTWRLLEFFLFLILP